MERNVSLFELLNLSIGSPHKSSVDFSALHALLLEMLKLLDLREATTRFKVSPPRDQVADAPPGAPGEVLTHPTVSDQLVPPGSDLHKLTDSVSVLDGTGGDDFRTSGDGVSQALNLIEELQKNRDEMKQKTEHLQSKASIIIEDLQRNSANLRQKAEELQHKALKVIEQLEDSKDLKETDDMQHKGVAEQMEIQAGLETCCQRLDVLDKAVESIQELFQMYPDPEELSECVTWVQLVQKDMEVEKDLETSEVLDQPWLVEQTGPDPSALSSGVPVPSTGGPVLYSGAAAPTSGASAPTSGVVAPTSGAALPTSDAGAPTSGAGAPTSGAGAPTSGAGATTSGAALPTSDAGAPTSSAGAPTSGAGAPTSGAGVPTSGAGAPTSGAGVPTSGAGAPTSGAPTSGEPTSGAPTSGAPTSGAPTSGAPTSGAPTSGATVPTSGAPTSGAPPSGAPTSGAPPSGAPTPGVPTSGVPTLGTSAPTPGAGAPTPGAGAPTPGAGAPTPGAGAPTPSAPKSGAPTSGAPTSGAPTSGASAPSPSAPTSGAPTPSAPTSGAPKSGAPKSGAPTSGVPVPSPGASAPSSHRLAPSSGASATFAGTTGLSPSASAPPSGSSSPASAVSMPSSGGPLHPESSPTSGAPSFPSISAEDQSSEAAADSTQASSDGSEGGTIAGDQRRATEPQPVSSAVLPESTAETVPQPGAQRARVASSISPGVLRGDLKRPSESSASRLHSQQMEEFVKNIRKLQDRVTQLEAQTRILEEEKVDWTGLDQFLSSRDNVRGSLEVPDSTSDQEQQQQALMENLKTEHKKLEHLEDMLGSLMSQETGSSPAGAADQPDPGIKDLTQQVSDLRSSLVQVEQEVELLKEKQAQSEERAADHLQDQLNDLRGTLEDTIVSLTSQLSSSLQQEVEQETEEAEEEEEEEEFDSSVEVGRKLSLLFQNYEQLEDTVNLLVQQQQQGAARVGLDDDREMGRSLDLVYDVQRAIQELQAECERLQEATRSLHEDNQQKQGHIEELYKTAEELQVKKADKLMVESEIKADKLALDSKVSRLQFDAATEQLTSMFHELLNKMTGQEHDWHQLVDKLSTDMECKLNRIELDSVKLQLEERWRSILKKLQTQSAPLEDDAAGIRKKLLERFQCLSCDRVIMKQTPGPIVPTLPTFPPFPPPKFTRPWTIDHIRQHYRSVTPGTSQRRVQLQKNHADMVRQLDSIERQRRLRQRPNRVAESPSRPVGVPHTSTSAGQRRSNLQHHRMMHRAVDEDLMQEADIIGRDGRIYKGRFSIGQQQSPETKLPNIVSKDGKLKERTRVTPKAPAVSPEAEPSPLATPPSLSTKSLQPSRPASSGSGPDWGASSPLGSVSTMSAAESEPLGL